MIAGLAVLRGGAGDVEAVRGMWGGEMERVRGVGVLAWYVLGEVVTDGWICGVGILSGGGDRGDAGGGLGLVELSM